MKVKSSSKITFCAPSRMTSQYIKYFILNVEAVFKLHQKNILNVSFSTKQTSSIDILGLLLIYKFFEYAVKKRLFIRPKCDLFDNTFLTGELKKHELYYLLSDFINFQDVPNNYNLRYRQNKDLFIAPMVLIRDGKPKEADYIPMVSNYYSFNKPLAAVLLTCIGEVKSNFEEHAVDDTKSIMMAKGNKSFYDLLNKSFDSKKNNSKKDNRSIDNSLNRKMIAMTLNEKQSKETIKDINDKLSAINLNEKQTDESGKELCKEY